MRIFSWIRQEAEDTFINCLVYGSGAFSCNKKIKNNDEEVSTRPHIANVRCRSLQNNNARAIGWSLADVILCKNVRSLKPSAGR